ncbi:MAG: hypothetical protein ABSA05_14755 [Opitutaceae bacterium]
MHDVAFSEADDHDFHNYLNKKPSDWFQRVSNWVQGLDLNQRPSGYEPAALNVFNTLLFTQSWESVRQIDWEDGGSAPFSIGISHFASSYEGIVGSDDLNV